MSPSSVAAATEENLSIQITFEDGSLGTILYVANGHPSFPKERIEVFSGGRILQLDNFQRLQGYGWPKLSAKRLFRQDKGQNAFVLEFLACVEEGRILIEKDELVDVVGDHNQSRWSVAHVKANLASKLLTFWRIGLGACVSVIFYRFALKTGVHPVCRIRSVVPAGEMFLENNDTALLSSTSPSLASAITGATYVRTHGTG